MKFLILFIVVTIMISGGTQISDKVFAAETVSSPLKQINEGIEPKDIACNEGFTLVLKMSNGNPVCVKPKSVATLIERGWAIHLLPDVDSTNQNSMQIKKGDFVVNASMIKYDNFTGFLATPNSDKTFPGIVMIHEWWGLNDNMKETARQLASQGYVVLAVDLFDGEVATDAQKAMQMVGNFQQEKAITNMNSAVNYLQTNYHTSKVGSIGWCFGGAQSLNLALNNDQMSATVIYYGTLVTDQDTLSKINWPVLGIFGELDQGITVEKVNQFEATLDKLEIPNEIIIYPGVDHAFANPTGARYAPVETEDAWNKTLEFFKINLT